MDFRSTLEDARETSEPRILCRTARRSRDLSTFRIFDVDDVRPRMLRYRTDADVVAAIRRGAVRLRAPSFAGAINTSWCSTK